MSTSSRTVYLVFAACLVFMTAFTFDDALGSATTMEELWSSDAATLSRKAVASTVGTCKSRVEIYGYKCEEHNVITKDGYILSLQRIPDGRRLRSHSNVIKEPVLLQHGLMMDGTSWLLNSPKESLGYILADNGYDVWIANTRGTVHSLRHASLSPDDSDYWDWSWDELVAYELPAIFQYVYRRTGHQKIHYIGHSLGTSTVLASISEKNLLSMLRSAVLLCPIAYMDQISSPLARAAADTFIARIFYSLGLRRFDPKGKLTDKLLKKLCARPRVNCFDKMTVFTGKNCCLNSSAVEVFLDHELQPTSTKTLIHMSQMIRRGTFTKFDYHNYLKNFKHYGQTSPPAYRIANIPRDLPIFISFGGADKLSDAKDVKHLLHSLKYHHQADKLEVKYVDNYAHADFVMAVNARQVLYDPIMAFLQHH